MVDVVRHSIATAPEQLASSFDQDGYLLIDDCYSASACNAIMAHMHKLIDDYDPDEQRTVFNPDDQAHAEAEYFRTSGDKIRFFLEKDAVDQHGKLIRDKHGSINKVGHALHDLDPLFNEFSRKPQVAHLAQALGFAEPLLVQSMYIFKPPQIGGEVHCHQDSTFLYTEPESCIGFWIALEDATIDNGCLWAAPGTHREPLRERFRYLDGELGMEQLNDASLPKPTIALEAKQGSLIALHGRLPHQSGPNTSPKSRQAYTLHLIDGKCSYPADNWLQRDADMPMRSFTD